MSPGLRSIITLIIGIVIFVALPLVGWGLKDVLGFIHHPARLIYILLAVLLQVLVVIKLPGVGRDGGKRKKIVNRQQLAVVLLQAISLAIVIAAPYSDRREIAVLGQCDGVRYLGLIMFSLGFITMHWAEASLKKQFSVKVSIQQDHRLVTDGPYRHLRHPRYLSIIIFTMGFSLVYRSWLALILVTALIVVLIWRMHDEEALMHQEFGADWEQYSRRTWRLVPFVY